ncbi:MAG: rhodanese-like domain-containing protein [Desulfobulbaceae bacterium]|nr:MAG: rhodanese-like domain-containing protein [Desulfobulbaceae bacterium]
MKIRFLLLFSLLLFAFLTPVSASEVMLMDKDELKANLGNSDVVILDVRAGRDWSSSELQIKGSVRVNPGDVDSWAGDYAKDKTYVLYCA